MTEKPRRHLLERFFVRWHMTLILTGVVLAWAVLAYCPGAQRLLDVLRPCGSP